MLVGSCASVDGNRWFCVQAHTITPHAVCQRRLLDFECLWNRLEHGSIRWNQIWYSTPSNLTDDSRVPSFFFRLSHTERRDQQRLLWRYSPENPGRKSRRTCAWPYSGWKLLPFRRVSRNDELDVRDRSRQLEIMRSTSFKVNVYDGQSSMIIGRSSKKIKWTVYWPRWFVMTQWRWQNMKSPILSSAMTIFSPSELISQVSLWWSIR